MNMERMLDKKTIPDENDIKSFIGHESYDRMTAFEKYLAEHYALNRERRFPFGNKYGWGYRYNHKAKHLCYLFFERGTFTVMLQIGDAKVAELEKVLPLMSEKTNNLWEHRYPCGDKGGWIHYQVLLASDMVDICSLIKIKCKVAR
jgi:hypothetical protein